MQISSSAADYIEAVRYLVEKNGQVRSIDIAHHLAYSKPSVSRAVANLKAEGYLDVKESGELVLTVAGEEVAKTMAERAKLLENLLLYAGVPQKLAKQDAGAMKYGVSDEAVEYLKVCEDKTEVKREKVEAKPNEEAEHALEKEQKKLRREKQDGEKPEKEKNKKEKKDKKKKKKKK